MSWKKLKFQYRLITDKVLKKKDYKTEWEAFKKLALDIEKNPPPAVLEIHNTLQILEENKKRKDIFIFDHGCGSALKVIYLAVLGYENIHGVNVNFDIDYVNIIMKDKFKSTKQRFFSTDGKKVPFPDKHFDLIISAQVAEHLRDDEVMEYYSEEGRVLKEEGFAYHELPHKYIPYESHTRLWLIHLFPYFCKPLLYGIFISIQKRKNLLLKGSYYANYYSKKFLILRTPNFHKKMLLKYIGNYQDLTAKRLKKNTDFYSYDHDSPIRIRKIIQKLFHIPILGKILILVLKNFFILQTLSQRNH
ncbi:class I SAM-dependent methyltransferase [Alphaproteobacteria bacterium]|nr:class I SAM-dependent methyltransferase [Alphaproteobacteria bacterium]